MKEGLRTLGCVVWFSILIKRVCGGFQGLVSKTDCLTKRKGKGKGRVFEVFFVSCGQDLNVKVLLSPLFLHTQCESKKVFVSENSLLPLSLEISDFVAFKKTKWTKS